MVIDVPHWFPAITIDLDAAFYAALVVLTVLALRETWRLRRAD